MNNEALTEEKLIEAARRLDDLQTWPDSNTRSYMVRMSPKMPDFIKRTFTERWLSWPWCPWKKTEPFGHVVKSGIVYMGPLTYEKFMIGKERL